MLACSRRWGVLAALLLMSAAASSTVAYHVDLEQHEDASRVVSVLNLNLAVEAGQVACQNAYNTTISIASAGPPPHWSLCISTPTPWLLRCAMTNPMP